MQKRVERVGVARFVSTTILSLAFVVLFTAAPAYAEEQPPVPTAPVASFDFTQTTTENPAFTVDFTEPVDAADAEDVSHYSLIHTDPALSKPSLQGLATATYNAVQRKATVTITDPSIVILDERVSFGVQNIRSLDDEQVIAPVTDSPVVATPPTQPGVPAATSGSGTKQTTWVWTPATDQGEHAAGVVAYGYELIKDGILSASGQTAETQVALTVAEDGVYTLRVWAIDGAGLTGEAAVSEPFLVDTTGPTVTIETPVQIGNTYTPSVVVAEQAVTYNWSYVGPQGGATISDIAAPQPVITFLADGTYTFTLVVTDAYGNATTTTVTLSYLAPFIPGQGNAIDPIQPEPIDFVDKVAEVSSRTVAANAVTPTIVSSVDQNIVPGVANTAAVPAAAAVSDIPAAVTPTAQGWRILGLLWYWWILIAAIVVTAWLWGRSVGRSQRSDDL